LQRLKRFARQNAEVVPIGSREAAHVIEPALLSDIRNGHGPSRRLQLAANRIEPTDLDVFVWRKAKLPLAKAVQCALADPANIAKV
jgi:hypothetical protein